MTFWRYVGDGALHGSLAQYDRDIVRELGNTDLSGAWALQQPTAAATSLHVVEIQSVAGGTSVSTEGIPPSGPKARWSFFLQREGGEWKIVYDTFTAAALGNYVQTQVQRRIDPVAEEPSPEALAAADRAVARFRAVALEP